MNNTVALDSHAEATEHRPISPIEHDRVAAAAAAHDALAIGEPLLIVAGGPAAVRTELCRALTTDRRAVGEDVLVLATRTDGAFPDASLAAYLGLPANGLAGATDEALAEALAQYATAETRLVLMLANAERLDDGGLAAIHRLRQADPAARALSVVLLGDDMVGLVGDRLLRPAPPGGLRFIRLTPLALAPAAPVAGLSAGPSIAPPVINLPPHVDPVSAASEAPSAPSPAAHWPAAGLTEIQAATFGAETDVPPPDHAAPWDAAPEPAALDAGPDDAVGSDPQEAYDHGAHHHGAHHHAADDQGAHDQAAPDQAAPDQAAHDHGAYHPPAYHQPAYEEPADDAADPVLADEPVDDYEPEAERTVPYWEALPERVPQHAPETHPAPATEDGRFGQAPAARDWQSFQDAPDPTPETVHAGAPVEHEYAAHVVVHGPPPAPPPKPKEAGRDQDWGTLKAAAQTGRYPPAAEGEAGVYAAADAAAYQDAFAQLAAQEARAVQPPRATPQPMLRRAQVLAGGGVEHAVDADGVPVEIPGNRVRLFLPFAGIAVLAALIGWFVVRAVVGAGHSTPPGLQVALSTPAPATSVPAASSPSTPAPATAAPSTAAVSTMAPTDSPPTPPAVAPAISGKAGAPGPASPAPLGAVAPAGGETAAAMAVAPSPSPPAAHANPVPPAKPDTAREAAAEHGRPPALAAAAPPAAEAAGAAAHPPPAAVVTAVPPPLTHPMPEHPAPAQQAMAPASPSPAAVAPAPMPAPVLPPGPGLLVIAKAEDTLQSLYNRVYKGLQAPPFEVVEAMNPHEIKLGDVVVFPAPPGGWHRLPNTAGR
jgi:hypothetical protein